MRNDVDGRNVARNNANAFLTLTDALDNLLDATPDTSDLGSSLDHFVRPLGLLFGSQRLGNYRHVLHTILVVSAVVFLAAVRVTHCCWTRRERHVLHGYLVDEELFVDRAEPTNHTWMSLEPETTFVPHLRTSVLSILLHISTNQIHVNRQAVDDR